MFAVRQLLAACFCVLAAVLVVTQGQAEAIGGASPLAALDGAPWHALSRARAAEIAYADTLDARALDAVVADARRALARAPYSVAALRTLGLADYSRQRERSGAALLALASTVTKRDLPTHLVAIEVAVTRGDVALALNHYDAALRTTQQSWPLLLPVLAKAAEQPQVARALAGHLAADPQWKYPFLTQFVAPTGSGAAMFRLSRELDRVGHPLIRDVRRAVLSKLIAEQNWDLARREYAAAMGIAAQGAAFVDGHFARAGALIPIDWLLASGGAVDVDQRGGAARGRGGIAYQLAGNGPAEIARKLLLLAPGSYRMSFAFGADFDSAALPPTVSLNCAVGVNRTIPLSPARAVSAARAVDFSVPDAECGGQWMVIRGESGTGAEAFGWIDAVKIQRSGR